VLSTYPTAAKYDYCFEHVHYVEYLEIDFRNFVCLSLERRKIFLPSSDQDWWFIMGPTD
jgi:hypothetical protein